MTAAGLEYYVIEIQIIVLLLSGIIGAKIAEKIGIPIVIPLVLTGYLIGPYSPLGLQIFNPTKLGVSLETLTNILIPLILFFGGLSFEVEILKRTYKPIFILATVGVALSAILFAIIGHYIFKMDLLSSLLIGTAVAATDIAAVETVLAGVAIKEEVLAILIGESAFNDATAIVLVSVIIGIARIGEINLAYAIMEFLRQFIGGVLLGYTMGAIIASLISQFKLQEYTTYFSLLLFLGTYASATFILTTYSFVNPAIAVVVAGIVFRHHFTERGVIPTELIHAISFWENIVFIAEVVIFMVLGASFSYVKVINDLFLAVMMLIIAILVVRPAAVFISTMGYELCNVKDKISISLLGARGSVSAGLASIILVSGLPHAETSFNVILVITITSLLIVGFGGRKLATNLCGVNIPLKLREYRKLKAELLATQEALKELRRRFDEGLIDIDIYKEMEKELKDEIQYLEKRIDNVYKSEELKCYLSEERLRVKRDIYEIKSKFLDYLKSRGEISEREYQKIKNRYISIIRRLNAEMYKVSRVTKREKRKWK